jgi:protein-disulfide isomerase
MSSLYLPVGKRDHFRGPADAPVTLVQYGDFECPYCGKSHGILHELLEDLGPQLRLVFRHFPLASIHPHAEMAALAAEAAGAQGKFWEMHDLLFENQMALEDEDLLRYAEDVDLEMAEFQEALLSGKYLPHIKDDFLSGVRSGVNGTPTFYINEVRHDGSFEYPVLFRALKSAVEVRLAH